MSKAFFCLSSSGFLLSVIIRLDRMIQEREEQRVLYPTFGFYRKSPIANR